MGIINRDRHHRGEVLMCGSLTTEYVCVRL